MKILFIIDPISYLHLPTDTTFAIMNEANRRRHEVFVAQLRGMFMQNAVPHAYMQKCAELFYEESRIVFDNETLYRLDEMDVIMMRKDPPFDIEYLTAAQTLNMVNRHRTIIVNEPKALMSFNEKIGILNLPDFIPPTIVTSSKKIIHDFLERQKEIILKPLHCFGGSEIVRVSVKDSNRFVLIEMLTKNETRAIMAQRFLPAVKRGDKRVLILNGKILGAAVRMPNREEHRNNISAGGTSHKTTLTVYEKKTCETIARKLKTLGIYFAGIDMIGGYITEINITSPAVVVEINEHENARLESDIINFLEKAHKLQNA